MTKPGRRSVQILAERSVFLPEAARRRHSWLWHQPHKPPLTTHAEERAVRPEVATTSGPPLDGRSMSPPPLPTAGEFLSVVSERLPPEITRTPRFETLIAGAAARVPLPRRYAGGKKSARAWSPREGTRLGYCSYRNFPTPLSGVKLKLTTVPLQQIQRIR